MIILKGTRAYLAPVGTEPGDGKVWHPVTIAEDVELVPTDEQDLYAELVKHMKQPVRSVTTTFKLSGNRLEHRAYLRMFFGIEMGSLIHNGKKRRKR